MIIISGRLTVRPEQRDRAIAATAALMAATRAEPGCADYAFSTEVSDPNVFRYFERWESEEAMKAHRHQPHMAEFMAIAGELVSGPADGTRYEVSSSTPLF